MAPQDSVGTRPPEADAAEAGMEPHPVLSQWERVRQGTLTTLGLFLEDELGYAPAPGGRTIREIALHIAHEEAIEVPARSGLADVLLLADSAALIAAQRNGIPPALESGTACRREMTPSR
jgi:hypothetical protein